MTAFDQIDAECLTDPELRLMWALLDDAARILRTHGASPWTRRHTLFTQTRDWVLADDPTWPFSFVNACTLLGVDAAQLRAELAPWVGLAPGLRPE